MVNYTGDIDKQYFYVTIPSFSITLHFKSTTLAVLRSCLLLLFSDSSLDPNSLRKRSGAAFSSTSSSLSFGSFWQLSLSVFIWYSCSPSLGLLCTFESLLLSLSNLLIPHSGALSLLLLYNSEPRVRWYLCCYGILGR